jgi:hypothetical protein
MMALTGSHSVDKYILPLFLDIKTVATLLNSSGYFKNLIYNCKKIMKNNLGYVPFNELDRLCKNDNYKCLKLLIKCGIDVNGIDDGYNDIVLPNKWTLLHYMCFNHHYECAKLLIESGANVNARTWCGSSPLIIACIGIKNTNIIELLLEHNANIDIMDCDGEDVLFRLYCRLQFANEIEKCIINECILLLKKMKMIQNNTNVFLLQ